MIDFPRFPALHELDWKQITAKDQYPACLSVDITKIINVDLPCDARLYLRKWPKKYHFTIVWIGLDILDDAYFEMKWDHGIFSGLHRAVWTWEKIYHPIFERDYQKIMLQFREFCERSETAEFITQHQYTDHTHGLTRNAMGLEW